MRTAGPFTVESLSPHRTLEVDENDELIDKVADAEGHYGKDEGLSDMNDVRCIRCGPISAN